MKKILVFIIITACFKEAIIFKGDFNTVILSSGKLKRAKRYLLKTLERIQYTPREEKIFELFEMDSLNNKEKFLYRNYLIISTPSSENFKFFKTLFGKVRRSGIYIRENPFLLGSFAMGIYGESESEILRIIKEKKDTIFNILYRRMIKSLREIALFPGIRKDLTEKVKEKFGLKIKIPKGYNIFKEGNDYISLVRHYPDRFIFIWRINTKVNLVPEEVIRLRNKFAKDVYAGDSVIARFLNFEYRNVDGYEALYLNGVWGNYTLKVGGGFESLIISKDGKTYFIDIGVHEPRKWKLKYLKMMESWAFYPEFENGKNN